MIFVDFRLPPSFRKILRLVKHTLASVSGVRDQEMALLDEMLAACAREASNKSLELIFSSHLFYQNRQERFIGSLAGSVHHTQERRSVASWPRRRDRKLPVRANTKRPQLASNHNSCLTPPKFTS